MAARMVLKLKNGQVFWGDLYRYNVNALLGYEFITFNGSVQINPDQIELISVEDMPETIQKAEVYACFMRESGNCKGDVKRFQVGISFVDICIRHCVYLMDALAEEGF